MELQNLNSGKVLKPPKLGLPDKVKIRAKKSNSLNPSGYGLFAKKNQVQNGKIWPLWPYFWLQPSICELGLLVLFLASQDAHEVMSVSTGVKE